MSFMDCTPAALYADYEDTSLRLLTALSNLSQAKCAQHEAKVSTWLTSPADTVRQRDMIADQAGLEFTRGIYIAQCEVDSARERLNLIDHVIAFRGLLNDSNPAVRTATTTGTATGQSTNAAAVVGTDRPEP